MAWLKRLLGRSEAAPAIVPEPDPAEDPAHQRGQEIIHGLDHDAGHLLAARYGTVKDDFLGIFRKSILSDLGQDDYSPILAMRASLAQFIEQIKSARESMQGEAEIAMYEFRRAFEEMGMEGEVERVIKARVADIAVDLQFAGLSMGTTFADAAKAADDDWRRRHPDKAAEQLL